MELSGSNSLTNSQRSFEGSFRAASNQMRLPAAPSKPLSLGAAAWTAQLFDANFTCGWNNLTMGYAGYLENIITYITIL
jgi:hypothetical protein